ncbi:glycerate kinase [bacterium]|nr:glycerate kinase [bacterium]
MDLKSAALDIFSEAVRAADPFRGVQNAVRVEDCSIVVAGERYPSDRYTKVYVIGGGKASARMGEALETVLGDRITGGWINTKDGHGVSLDRITVHECGHPVPDERGIYGTRQILEILDKEADEHTLVICLLSGGGSALMPAPAEGITLGEKQEVTGLLLRAGASIGELNAVRKHLSRLKGGGMARLAFPARLHLLILSDVIGDPLDVIASGPGIGDTSTFGDCVGICTRLGIMNELPASVRTRFLNGVQGTIPETAKAGDPLLAPVVNTLIGNNRMSVEAARKRAESLGFNTLVLTTTLAGEASCAGTFYSSVASEIHTSGNPLQPPACIITGGETTVTVRGNGKGGRNQEMALTVARCLAGMDNFVFLSAGTDGTDGPTDAAGGMVDGSSIRRGDEKGLDVNAYLENNDSYNYLKAVDGLVMTGPTGTNVMDIQILLAGES